MRIYTKEMIKLKNAQNLKLKKLLKIIFIPILIVFLVYCITMAFQKLILNKSNLSFLGYRTYIVLTGSMEPIIKPNDLIIVKSVPEDKIKEGSIINFSSSNSGTTITHRVVNIIKENGKTYYKTKGDNNNVEDSKLISLDDIYGIVIFKISKVGLIFTKILTGAGLSTIFILLALSYHHSSIKEDRRLTREEARKKYNYCKYKKDEENINEAI